MNESIIFYIVLNLAIRFATWREFSVFISPPADGHNHALPAPDRYVT